MDDKALVKGIIEAFRMPVVFHPGGWEDTVPEYMRRELVIRQRLDMALEGAWDRATDVEVVCYYNTASLAAPLTEQDTRVYIHTAGVVMPAIKEYFDQSSVGKVAGSLTPDELSDYDKAHLNDLKFKIRNSQLKRRKETMSKGKLKIILDEREGAYMVGVVDEGADPVISTVPGDLATVLQAVPAAVTAAEEKWKVNKRNPAYTAPAVPKPAPKPPAPKVEKVKPVADLPLLASKPTETLAEPPVEVAAAPASEAAVAPVPVVAAVESSAPATPEKLAPGGKESFYLDDSRGPFASVQEAFDALGMDQATRPHHNRYDRLSEALKKRVIRG